MGSINVRKVTWTCDELGLLHAREDWGGSFRDPRSPEFVALNPMAHVPVLIDGDFALWESNTIVRYLAGAFGGEALLPRDPRARASVEKWMDWQVSDLNASWRPAFHVIVRNAPGHSAQAVSASVRAWSDHVAILDAQLSQTGAFIAGDAFSLADIPIGLSVHRWLNTPMARPTILRCRRTTRASGSVRPLAPMRKQMCPDASHPQDVSRLAFLARHFPADAPFRSSRQRFSRDVPVRCFPLVRQGPKRLGAMHGRLHRSHRRRTRDPDRHV